ncbi:hypothetical protein MCBRY_000813 [Methylocystis bryophila]
MSFLRPNLSRKIAQARFSRNLMQAKEAPDTPWPKGYKLFAFRRFRAARKKALRVFGDIARDSENEAERLAEAASIDGQRIKVIDSFEIEGLESLPLSGFSASRPLGVGSHASRARRGRAARLGRADGRSLRAKWLTRRRPSISPPLRHRERDGLARPVDASLWRRPRGNRQGTLANPSRLNFWPGRAPGCKRRRAHALSGRSQPGSPPFRAWRPPAVQPFRQA